MFSLNFVDNSILTPCVADSSRSLKDDDVECSLTSVSILIPSDEAFDAFGEIKFNFQSQQFVDAFEDQQCKNSHNKILFNIENKPEDNTSISSVSTSSSHNNDSIEEALRALDFAIEGEDVSPDDPIDNIRHESFHIDSVDKINSPSFAKNGVNVKNFLDNKQEQKYDGKNLI